MAVFIFCLTARSYITILIRENISYGLLFTKISKFCAIKEYKKIVIIYDPVNSILPKLTNFKKFIFK